MATAPQSRRLNLTRDQLAQFLTDQQQIRQFELLFSTVDQLQVIVGTDFEYQADTAAATANEALAQLSALAQDTAVEDAVLNAKVQQALDAVAQFARTLEMIATAPAIENNNSVVTDYIDFNTTTPSPAVKVGRMHWNGGYTLNLEMTPNVNQAIGESQYYYIKASAAIAKGELVMFDGSVGASGVLKGKPSTGVTNGQLIMGVAAEAIANNGFGLVSSFGLVRGFNTTGTPYGETWADGDILYYNPSFAGGLTKNLPTAPIPHVVVAAVVNAATAGSGSVFVRVQAEPMVKQLSDVYAPTPANNDVLIYDSVQQRWKNAPISTAGAVTSVTGTSPVVSSGGATPAISLASGYGDTQNPYASKTANYVLAAPNGSSGLPTFRALVAADIPSLSYVSSVSATAPITSTGGTTPTIGVTSSALTKTDDTNVTLTLGGSPSTALLAATSLTLGWTGQLSVSRGGTGLSSLTANRILYASATNTVGTSGTFLFDGTNMAVNSTSLGAFGVLTLGDTNGTAGFGAPNAGFGDWVYAGGPGNTLRVGPSGYNSGQFALMYTTSGGVRTEGFRLTASGGASFGSSGIAYGTANQILQSNGNAPPTWTSTPTITGTNFTGIPNGALTNSSITINGSSVSLGGSTTVTAVNPFALTIGTGLSGTSYNGSAAVTIANTGVLSFSAGTTGLTPNSATTGAVTLAGTLAVGNGGTGTATAFTAGSAIFAGASGVYSQDNTNYFWDNTNKRLGLGTNSPQQRADLRGTPGATMRLGSVSHGGPGDEFANIEFYWADPDAAEVKAKIYAKNVGNVGPGGGGAADLLFATTPAGGALTERMRIEAAAGVVRPGADNTQNLGSASFRWATVFAGNGTINTSDANEKTDIQELDEVEQRVANKIRKLFKKYRMKDSVALKGDGARIHFGAIAQQVFEAFASEGLDANRYGVFCEDVWREHNGTAVETDKDGFFSTYHWELDGQVIELDGEDPPNGAEIIITKHETTERRRLGLRYDELFAFVLSSM
jgi:hypothetical protein